jgi:predicted nucleic acid-binding protein
VLDAWALVAFLDDQQPAAAKVEAALGEAAAAACSINVGEVLYRQIRAVGPSSAKKGIAILRQDIEVVDADWGLVVAAAEVKASGKLSYADAFCVATAQRLAAPLWTGDPEIVDQRGRLPCEVIDLRIADD